MSNGESIKKNPTIQNSIPVDHELDNFLPDYGDEYDRERINGDEDREEGCCFPGKCFMSGPHFRSECHTAEMFESYAYRAKRGLP